MISLLKAVITQQIFLGERCFVSKLNRSSSLALVAVAR